VNTFAVLGFVHKLSAVKSPSAFVELSTEYARRQFQMLTEQTKQLASLAQSVMLAAAEPMKMKEGTSESVQPRPRRLI
jgi:hypothetical protein